MKSVTLAFVLFLATRPFHAGAQVPTGNPVVDAARGIGAKGLGSGAVVSVSPTVFKPSGGRVYVKRYLREMVDEESERLALEAMTNKLIVNFESGTAGRRISNDASAALAFSTAILYSISKGTALDDDAFLALVPLYRSYFKSAGIEVASDLKKQECYEWALCSAALVMGVAGVSDTDEQKEKVKLLARTQLTAMLGVNLDQISLKGSSVSIRKVRPASAPTESGPKSTGFAPGFTFTTPAGWTQQNGWYVNRKLQLPQVSQDFVSALVRFPPAIPAQGSFTEALRRIWKESAPPELIGKASGMVYRRYIGDGLVSQFIFGQGTEAGRKSDTLVTLYLIDCGKSWQPVIVAQTYEDPNPNAVAVGMSAGFSYGMSADMAETLLAQFRCPAAKGRPLVDRTALIGSYAYGSSSALQFENIYTGATSMSVVSYGGTLNLQADGTFDYRFSSASGRVGATQFKQAKGTGKWTVKGDLLTCKFSTYDQGDSYKATSNIYRVAGLVQFNDGVKVAVLKSMLKAPINAVTVADRSDYFSTKKK